MRKTKDPYASKVRNVTIAEVEKHARAVPGPGQYDTTGASPYLSRLELATPGPSIGAPSGKFDLWGNEGNPGPGTYDIPTVIAPTSVIAQSNRDSFVDEAERRGGPGPGAYHTKSSHYAAKLDPSTPGPSIGAPSGKFDLWGNEGNPGPGTYDIPTVIAPTSVIGQGSRESFVDDIARRELYKPGPGAHDARAPDENLGGQWGDAILKRELWQVPPTPGPGRYDPHHGGFLADTRSPLRMVAAAHAPREKPPPPSKAKQGGEDADANQGPGEKKKREGALVVFAAAAAGGDDDDDGGGDSAAVAAVARPPQQPSSSHSRLPRRLRARADEGLFAEVERRAAGVPGPGAYDTPGASPYLSRLGVATPGVALGAAPGKFNLFGADEGVPGPGAYAAPPLAATFPAAPRVSQLRSTATRATFVDLTVAAAGGVPGPQDYRAAEAAAAGVCASVAGGAWGDALVKRELWRNATPTPAPDAYGRPPVTWTKPSTPGGWTAKNDRPSLIDEAVRRHAASPAPGQYEPADLLPPPRKPPGGIESRVPATSMVFPSTRGPNPGAVYAMATSERKGGFRKVGDGEVVSEYGARLRHTKDCAAAYAIPSTYTNLVAANDTFYKDRLDAGQWRAIPTGGAVFRASPQGGMSCSPSSSVAGATARESLAAEETERRPLPRQLASVRKEYAVHVRLGRDRHRVEDFVKRATAAEAATATKAAVKTAPPPPPPRDTAAAAAAAAAAEKGARGERRGGTGEGGGGGRGGRGGGRRSGGGGAASVARTLRPATPPGGATAKAASSTAARHSAVTPRGRGAEARPSKVSSSSSSSAAVAAAFSGHDDPLLKLTFRALMDKGGYERQEALKDRYGSKVATDGGQEIDKKKQPWWQKV